MPIPGVNHPRYRWKTNPDGSKIRLTFSGKKVVEVKKPGKKAKRVK